MRDSVIDRKTNETDIRISLVIDGSGKRKIDTGIGFFDHMLDLFAKHGLFDLTVSCKGDTWIDDHHSIEDVGIVLGQVFDVALGDRKGIKRYGQRMLPMDESLILSAVDIGGRPAVIFEADFDREKLGDMATECVYEFLLAFALNAKMNLAVKILEGKNNHHKIEGIFKSLARALREACEIDERARDKIPSTKGIV